MYFASHILQSTWRIGSGDNFITDISKWLDIGNLKEAYWSTNKVNYFQRMLKHNDRCNGHDYMEKTLSYLALQGWYDIDSAKVVNLQSAANIRWNTPKAHHPHLQHCQEGPLFCRVWQQVHHLRDTHICRVGRSMKLTTFRAASEDFGISNIG